MSVNNKIPISEIFESLQGEGPVAGHPAIFVRTAFCNLNCGSEANAKWKCDTWNIMRTATREYEASELVDYIRKLPMYKLPHQLIFTGGEPLLYASQLSQVMKLLNLHNDEDCIFENFDVETNGTIYNEEFFDLINGRIIVSPKLSNSGIPRERRFHPEVYTNLLVNHYPTFKFVVKNQEDVDEILRDFVPLMGDDWRDYVWLMPAMETIAEGKEVKQFVWKTCVELGIPMSLRTHIEVWDKKAGV